MITFPLRLLVISDAGHGWMRVEKKTVKELCPELCAAISFYSYQDANYLYLEEDMDMPLILEGLRKHGEVKLFEEHVKGDCFVRNLKRVNV